LAPITGHGFPGIAGIDGAPVGGGMSDHGIRPDRRRRKGVMPTSKETGHGGVGCITVFDKKLREQGPWKVRKKSCSWYFGVLQLPKIILEMRVKDDVEEI
jgi:hypothetical protein